MLDLHNELRRRVAKGEETNGPQPAAANMRKLVSRVFHEIINHDNFENRCSGIIL